MHPGQYQLRKVHFFKHILPIYDPVNSSSTHAVLTAWAIESINV